MHQYESVCNIIKLFPILHSMVNFQREDEENIKCTIIIYNHIICNILFEFSVMIISNPQFV